MHFRLLYTHKVGELASFHPATSRKIAGFFSWHLKVMFDAGVYTVHSAVLWQQYSQICFRRGGDVCISVCNQKALQSNVLC